MKRNIVILLALLFPLLTFIFFLAFNYPTTNPFRSSIYFVESFFNPHAPLKKDVIGFLPYWRMDDIKYIKLNFLSEINYFSLYVGPDGRILKVQGNETDPGWREWNNETLKNLIARSQIRGTKFSVSITSQNNEDIDNILNNKKAQENLISDITDQVKKRHLNGVNIDFEYLGKADEKYKDKFTLFAKDLSDKLRGQFPEIKLYLSIMPLSAREKDIFDFPKISPYFDRFIGMSYDYYGTSSDIAGPVAPMKGFKENKFFFDVATTYEDYARVLPKDKLIMGVPYYGWDWAVEDEKINSRTLSQDDPDNYAAVMSYGRMKESDELKKAKCQWDDYALETWCRYTKDGVYHQVWLEDEKSIGIKYDFARQQNFAGVAIWVLGYDKDRTELWEKINSTFTK